MPGNFLEALGLKSSQDTKKRSKAVDHHRGRFHRRLSLEQLEDRLPLSGPDAAIDSSMENWSHRADVVIPQICIEEDLESFPVRLSEDSLPAEIFSGARENGGDIRFSSDPGGSNILPAEVVSFSAEAGTAQIIVNVPHLSSSQDTPFYVWWGNDAVSGQPAEGEAGNSKDVWDAELILHCEESPTGQGDQVMDSSGNEREATAHGGMDASRVVEGIFGNGIHFDGNDYISVPHDPELGFDFADPFTVSMWVKPESQDHGYLAILEDYAPEKRWVNPGWHISHSPDSGVSGFMRDSNGKFIRNNTMEPLTVNQWKHVAVTYDGSRRAEGFKVYVNGEEQEGTFTDRAPGASAAIVRNLNIGFWEDGGIGGFIGEMDEPTVQKGVQSPASIKATVLNGISPASFAVAGEAVELGTEADGGGTGNEEVQDSGAGNNEGSDANNVGNQVNAAVDKVTVDSSMENWSHRADVVIPQICIEEDLESFPVRLSEDSLPAEIFSGARENGGDIRFSSDPGGSNILPAEVVSFSAEPGTAQIIVNVPHLSSSQDTPFYVWWGNDAVSGQPAEGEAGNSKDVWDAELILHCEDSPTGQGDKVLDSSGNERNATAHGGMDASRVVEGIFGNGIHFDGNDYISVPHDPELGFDFADPFTVSMWVKPESQDHGYLAILEDYAPEKRWVNPGWHISHSPDSGVSGFMRDSNGKFIRNNTMEPLTVNQWKHVAVTYDGSRRAEGFKVYVNGEEQEGTFTDRAPGASAAIVRNLNIGFWEDGGIGGFTGDMDGIVINKGVESSARIKATALNGMSPSSFAVAGEAVELGAPTEGGDPVDVEQETQIVADAVDEVMGEGQEAQEEVPPVSILEFLNDLNTQRNQAEAVVQQLEADIAGLKQQISAAQEEISDLQTRLEAGEQTPDCRFSAGRNSINVYAYYHSLPEGMQMQILNGSGAMKASKALPVGDGMEGLRIPNVGTDFNMKVQLVHPESGVVPESVTKLAVFRNNAYLGLNSGVMELTNFASNWDEEAFTQERDALAAQVLELTKQRDALAAQLPAAEATLSDTQEALRSAIPYSRMWVEATVDNGGGHISIRYATPLDNIRFRFTKGYGCKDSGSFESNLTKEITGGTNDTNAAMHIPQDRMGIYPGNAFGWYALEMLDEDGTVLDVVQIGKTGGLRSSQDPFEKIDTGRCIENPIEPKLQVAAISGTVVVFASSAPHDEFNVRMEGGGIMSSRHFERTGGTEVLMGQVFFDASNPAGKYDLTLMNKKGMILDQVTLKWDGQELSLTDAADNWTADDQVINMLVRGEQAVAQISGQTEQMAGIVDVVSQQTGLNGKNVDDYPVLRQYQEEELWRVSQFHMTREDLEEAYYVKRPEMRNPETEQLRIMRGDTLGALWENLHLYGGVVGRVLDKAVDVYFVAQRGGDQEEALAKVQQEIDIWGGHPKLAELTIETGIILPTRGEAMAEGLRIYEEHTGIFYNLQNMKTQEFVKQEYRSSSIHWQIVYGGQSPGTGGEGVLVASAGGIDEIVDGSGSPVLSGVARRLARIGLRIQEMEQQAASGGYVDPRFEPWLNTRDDPNVQRERWKESISTVIAMVGESEGGDEGGEENSEEENPLKPSVAYAITEVAALDRVVDVTMEGIRAEEELRFGEELDEALSDFIENNERWKANALSEGIWIIGHEVRMDMWHLTILMQSNDAEDFQNYTPEINDHGMAWMTLSASSDQLFFELGNLKSDINRENDDPNLKTNFFVAPVQLPDNSSIRQAISTLFAIDSEYKDSAPYDVFAAEGQFNCNSYIAGLLWAARFDLPDLPEEVFAPGYYQPLPIPYE